VAALPLSLGVHALIVAGVVASSLISPPPPRVKKPEVRPVSVRRIDARTWASNRAARPAVKAPERPEALNVKGQVVDVAPGNRQVPPEAKYLAESNNRVERETRAKEQTNTYSVARPKSAPQPEARPAVAGEQVPPPVSGVSLAESYFGRRQASPLSPTLSPPGERGEVVAEATGGEATEGGGAPNDDLTDVSAGDGTFLNTREWKHAAFFNRVKQAVSAKWDPNARLKARRDGLGALARTTVLHVALRPDGTLAEVAVGRSCGLDALDVEAMNAFSKAQPFPNPPTALVQDGYIRFAFSFHVTEDGLSSAPLRFR
jgi:TonB family protein